MSTLSRPAPSSEPLPERETQPFIYMDADIPVTGLEVTRGGGFRASSQAAVRVEQAAREAGRMEGEARVRTVYEQQVEALRQGLAKTVADFRRERASYFEKVELEVVQLALAIARKVLHREAQVDPLLLAGIVRVALDRLESGTQVAIRVAPQQVSDWRTYFARCLDEPKVPEIVEDASLPSNQCVLKTDLGTTTLGLEVQLKEIEQGLMDLLARSPSGTP